VVGWGTPHQWFRLEPDFAPLFVVALSLAVLWLLRVRPSVVAVLISLLVGFSWLAAARAINPVLPSVVLIGLLAGMAKRRAG
jgi:hypothetical protein